MVVCGELVCGCSCECVVVSPGCPLLVWYYLFFASRWKALFGVLMGCYYDVFCLRLWVGLLLRRCVAEVRCVIVRDVVIWSKGGRRDGRN